MNKTAVYIFTIWIGLSILIQPIMPFITFYVFQPYIQKNLCEQRTVVKSCCKGKCFLKKSIQKNEESQNTKDDNKKSSKNQNETEIYFALISPNNKIENFIYSKKGFNYSNLYSYIDISSIYHPPC